MNNIDMCRERVRERFPRHKRKHIHAGTKETKSSSSECKFVKRRHVEGYFQSLETAPSDLREKNDNVHKYIRFNEPVAILGWSVHGKNGSLRGPFLTRRGIITEYKVQYKLTNGSWKAIFSNAKTKDKVFVNRGNTAIPVVNTTTRLQKPVVTKLLRVFPQLWDGVPYIFMQIDYCSVTDRKFPGTFRGKQPKHLTTSEILAKLLNKKAKNKDEILLRKHKSKGRKRNKQKQNKHKTVTKLIKNSKVTIQKNDKKGQPNQTAVNQRNENDDSNHHDRKFPGTFRGKQPKHLTTSEILAKLLKKKAKNKDEILLRKHKSKGRKRNKQKQNKHKTVTKLTKNSKVTIPKNDKKGQPNQTAVNQRNENDDSNHHDIDGPIDSLAGRLHHKLKNITDDSLSKNIIKQDMKCSKTSWRYTGKSPPFDEFKAFGDSHQAWRAIYDLDVQPYQFPVERKGKNYLQINFHNHVMIQGIKIIGGNDENRWGVISKFGLFYQMGNQIWRFYSDDKGKPRIFYIGEKNLSNVFSPFVFHLPTPIIAKSVRIYPKKWNGKPLMSIDFKTCDLIRKSRRNVCSSSILKQGDKGILLKFSGLKQRNSFQNNFKYKMIVLSETKPVRVTAIKLSPPSTDDEDGNFFVVTDLILQYQTKRGKWKNVVDKDHIVKIFSLERGELGYLNHTSVKLWKPIYTRLLRVFPESWSGKNPVVFVNILGCMKS